jgi:hypothetical protein
MHGIGETLLHGCPPILAGKHWLDLESCNGLELLPIAGTLSMMKTCAYLKIDENCYKLFYPTSTFINFKQVLDIISWGNG